MLKRIRELLGLRAPRDGSLVASPAPPSPDPVPLAPQDEPPPVHRGPDVVHQPIPESDIDPDALKIVRRLTRFDHTAYLVGGCVRDLLLDVEPKDFDVGTSATPRQIKRLFRNCRIIGRRFRLAHIFFANGKIIEVATFRALDGADESDTADRPEREDDDLLIRDDNVFGTPEEDALRRDFTINQLFYDVDEGTVLDHAGGLHDLRRRLVRTIGDPIVRLREDPIRILRAIKFAARLGFDIETSTARAIAATRQDIPKAAPPRILEEINRFCRGGAARRSFELSRETGVFEIILPEFSGLLADDDRWTLFAALLDRIDHGHRDRRPVPTGDILVSLVLPLLTDAVGWKPDGTATPVRGVDVRTMVDDALRPMAQRLRVARKDQEHCRQVVAGLVRMVPPRRGRGSRRGRGGGRGRGDSMREALSFLEVVGATWGGVFREAAEHWSRSLPAAPSGDKAAPSDKREPRPRDGEPRRDGKRGRRRRSGGRGGGERRPETTERPASAPRSDLPPVWDDRYFFAALPSVPEGGPKESAEPPPEAAAEPRAESVESAESVETTTKSGGKRRRRRRRRGGSKSGGASAESEPEAAEGGSES